MREATDLTPREWIAFVSQQCAPRDSTTLLLWDRFTRVLRCLPKFRLTNLRRLRQLLTPRAKPASNNHHLKVKKFALKNAVNARQKEVGCQIERTSP